MREGVLAIHPGLDALRRVPWRLERGLAAILLGGGALGELGIGPITSLLVTGALLEILLRRAESGARLYVRSRAQGSAGAVGS